MLTHDQVNASSITKITSGLKFLGKNLHLVDCATVCGKSEVMLLGHGDMLELKVQPLKWFYPQCAQPAIAYWLVAAIGICFAKINVVALWG